MGGAWRSPRQEPILTVGNNRHAPDRCSGDGADAQLAPGTEGTTTGRVRQFMGAVVQRTFEIQGLMPA
ncbi:hypothetical protein B0T44_17415 [Nocardia donostiensis]|nr:hypothetical protein B0T36_01565 [Nocardia donostiensis]OQS18888.1 hypothetical protein B0T44_17415 [Nocardia donostiensis]